MPDFFATSIPLFLLSWYRTTQYRHMMAHHWGRLFLSILFTELTLSIISCNLQRSWTLPHILLFSLAVTTNVKYISTYIFPAFILGEVLACIRKPPRNHHVKSGFSNFCSSSCSHFPNSVIIGINHHGGNFMYCLMSTPQNLRLRMLCL